MNSFNHRNELRAHQQRQQEEAAHRVDTVVGIICIALCLLYSALSYYGVI